MNNKELNHYDAFFRVCQAAAFYPNRLNNYSDKQRENELSLPTRSEIARIRIILAKILGVDDSALARIVDQYQKDLSDDQLYSKIKLAIMGMGD